MFRLVNVVTTVASFSVLAACMSGVPASPASPATEPRGVAAAAWPALMPDRDCGGSGGVKVMPCPIVLTRHTKAGIVVTVSGPGVTSSYLARLNDCFHHRFCYNAEREGSTETQWRITSGRDCGGADIQFLGVNASGSEVGDAFLRFTNEYCP